jgi:hypothetical protein
MTECPESSKFLNFIEANWLCLYRGELALSAHYKSGYLDVTQHIPISSCGNLCAYLGDHNKVVYRVKDRLQIQVVLPISLSM